MAGIAGKARVERGTRLPELSVVSLVRDIKADGRTFPAGARGTVVAAYADGNGDWSSPSTASSPWSGKT